MSTAPQPDLTVIIVSYRTPELICRCLETLYANQGTLDLEVFVVDNASNDGTLDLIASRFPRVSAIPLTHNVGFGAANNVALRRARGRYWVLLNSDAFVQPGALEAAVRNMDREPLAGAGGARLTHPDGSWQASACLFPSPLNDFLLLSGLAAKWPSSRFFTRMNRRWADPAMPVETEWVPGAFMILRPAAMRAIGGGFDESFFLYYEEVDLCRRLREAGYQIHYWPDIRVEHLGGESAKAVKSGDFREQGSQLTLWRYRSEWIYYRKHHGLLTAWLARGVESGWHLLRAWRNELSRRPSRRRKAKQSRLALQQISQTWNEALAPHLHDSGCGQQHEHSGLGSGHRPQ